ncbi:Mu transposase C-terminal domain-containing protein [Flavobacterium restrictum]|uniref:DDE-type integrase/transposase/recombinase n=1 Tax=Flavobacterium restrictum TaxID=2594428 RepID=A0A553E212_9FLAO|nr:Mu transposase C-terminal domain-containing protein [Flavobacterium restrictum]TRX39071.1 DDE-type integrase/transposase/recombinase [Flavobacterium restrictum]
MYYIPFNSILDYTVPFNTITDGCKKYRQGKSKSWANKKDTNDKRKVLIDIDSIPEPTRKKYNIPTGREYFEQEELDRYTATQEKIQKEKELRADVEKLALHDAYNNGYMPFVAMYRERYSYNRTIKDDVAVLSAREHAFWVKMVEVTGTKYKTYDGGCKRGFNLYMELKKELVFTKDFANENYFRILLLKFRTKLLKEQSIVDVVVNGHKKPREKKKTNEFHKGVTMAFLSHPNKYPYRVVTDLVNHHCIEENQPEITESWVKFLMASDNHFRTFVMASRNGNKFTTDNLFAFAVRKTTPFPADCWMIDGTPVQFYCWNESRTKSVRLNLFVIIDVCTRKIVGFDISYSESKFEIMNALKNTVMMEGHLPAEIVSDNFSASKSEEIMTLKAQMEKIGTIWRHAKVGNPQDKTYVERFFGTFQSVECALYDDYIGEGITSKRDNRRNAEHLEKTVKAKGLPTYSEMISRIVTMITKYNERAKTAQKSPLEVYRTLPKPNAKELDSVRTALLFWKRTKVTVRRGMVKIIIKETPHFYEVYENHLKAELQGKEVYVRYDENDLECIMLFDKLTDLVICKCNKSLEFHTAQVNRKQEDIENTYKTVAKNKSYEKYLKDGKNTIIDNGLKAINKENLDLIHPLMLDKNKINEKESLEVQEYYLNVFKIAKGDEEQPQTKPLGTIHQKGVITDYTDLLEQKKPQKGFSKPTLAGVDK